MSEISTLISYVETGAGTISTKPILENSFFTGWEGFPVRRFQYSKTDPDGTVKLGDVCLLDPTPDRLARWVHAAITEVRGTYSQRKAFELVDACGGAGGFQFPVRGVHWENMTPIFTAYTFFDGVTVRLKGWNPSWPTSVLRQDQLDGAVFASCDDVAEAMKYARIQSTTRKEYQTMAAVSRSQARNGASGPPDDSGAAGRSRDRYRDVNVFTDPEPRVSLNL
jgi:hypothetical protein